jgi:heme exporter protein C
VHLSVVWWRSLHQGSTVFRLGGPEIHGAMLVALLAGVAAFTVVYAYLMTLRLRVGRLEERAVREALSPTVAQVAEEDA